ncbi:MAG: M56 family metallopeptidase [Bacteroidia bacterium]|nr:MAG: M56 family metallopeptidase [Bacteroidia bacterium]
MAIYLFKMMVCSLLFYGFYYFFLSKEKMFVFNRFYLLGTMMLSFIIPAITITTQPSLINQPHTNIPFSKMVDFPIQQVKNSIWSIDLQEILFFLILAISLVLLMKLMVNFSRIITNKDLRTHLNVGKAKLVLVDKVIVPHSFLQFIFVSRQEYEAGKIEAEVLEHELAHVHQKHSWDIILIELVTTIFWFHPIFYLYKRSIKINHELLADAAVIKLTDDVRSYQQVLLQRAASQSAYHLASSFNYYITKKRFIMLKKSYRKKRATALGFTVLPLILSLFFAFCNRVEKQTSVETNSISTVNKVNDSIQLMDDDQQTISKGISEQELNEFKTLLEKSSILIDGKRNFRIKEKVAADRVIALYNQMSMAQKESVKELGMIQEPPQIPPPPPPVETKQLEAPKIELKRFTPPKIINDFPEGKGATTDELKEYEAIVKAMKAGSKGYKYIEGKSDKILPIYEKMTFAQRSKASQLPPPPPPIEIKQFTPPKIVKDSL